MDQIISQDIVNIVVNSSLDINTSVNVNSSVAMNDSVNYVEMCNKCLELEAELIKQHNMVEKDEYNRLSKSFSKLEQHCISLELAMQLNKEIFQKNNTSVNQTEPLFDQLFELNNLKAELQAKDTTIEKLKANIKCSNKTSITNTEKVFVITTLKNDVRKFKGKDIVDNVAQASNATTIAPRMYKLDPVTLAPKDKNNRETHIYYRKNTIEQAVILRDIVEQSKSLNPLDIASYYACNSMFDARHELCFLEFVSDMNASSKSMSVKKAKKKKEWKLQEKSQVVQIVLWYLDFGCSKHMTRDRSQLTNLVHKFLGTVKFSNDQIAKIMGYGDYQIGNITISRVYYVEDLGLFSNAEDNQDTDEELAKKVQEEEQTKLTAMASEQSNLDPALHEMTPAIPMFDEFFSPPATVASLVLIEEAPAPVESTGSPFLTAVDQDAPSPSTSQTTP
ncbi:hypothetical protein Tco_0825196 [Tanacetum coccineum]